MLRLEERQAQEIEDLRKARDEYANEKRELCSLVVAIQALISTPLMDEQSDTAAFGRGAWVYCSQHMRPHQTGWCSVSPRDKIGLGVATSKEAYEKCEAWKLPLYDAADHPAKVRAN